MEIEQVVALPDEFLQDGHNPILHAGGDLLGGKLAVHVSMGPALVGDDGIEVGAGHHNEVSPLQAHVRIEIGGEEAPRLVPLDPSDQEKGISRVLSVNLVDIQLIGGVGEMHHMFPLGEGLARQTEEEQDLE